MVHEDVTAAWQRTLDRWDDPARHEELLALVARHACFAWASARYKERAGDPVADRQLERLSRAALATMLASASARAGRPRGPYRRFVMWLVVMVVMMLLGLGLAKLGLEAQPVRPALPPGAAPTKAPR